MTTSALLAGLTVLIIGDSHMVTVKELALKNLIVTLHDDLIQQGANVHSIGICGTVPLNWTTTPEEGICGGAERIGTGPVKLLEKNVKAPPIKMLFQTDKPDLVLVVMGDTMADYKKPDFPKVWFWQQVSGLTREIAAAKIPCAWIGPPWGTEGGRSGKTFERAKLISATLSKSVAPCVFIDSQKYSKPGAWPTMDGVHYNDKGYLQWGQDIANSILELRSDNKLKR